MNQHTNEQNVAHDSAISKLPLGTIERFVSPGVRVDPADKRAWLQLRRADVTASAIGALLNVHPHKTAYELWCEKTGRLAPDDDLDSPAMRRGRELEPLAAKFASEELTQGHLYLNTTNSYWRDPVRRIGATPDMVGTSDRGLGVVQLKSVAPSIYQNTWLDDEPPLWVALQALTEANLLGAQWAAVGALRVGFGIEFTLTEIPLHEGAWARMLDLVETFWRRVDGDVPPPAPDYERDGALIAAMYRQSLPTKVDMTGDNELMDALVARSTASAQIKILEAERDRCDALIRHKAGDNEMITAGDFRVTLKTQTVEAHMVKAHTRRPIFVRQKAAP